MPVYEVELEDGRIVELEADYEPSESDILAAIGNQPPQETADIPLRSAESFRVPSMATVGDGSRLSLPSARESFASFIDDAGDFRPIENFGRGMGVSGQALKGGFADAANLLVGGEAITPEDPFENLRAAAFQEPLPVNETIRNLPTGQRLAVTAAGSIPEVAPRLAGTAALTAAGVPIPAAAAINFGVTNEGEVSPKDAALAAAIPFVGRYGGRIASEVAKRYGISSDRALQAVNAAGNQAAANTYLGVAQVSEIVNLPEEERADAWIDAIAANVGQSLLAAPEVISSRGRPAAPPETVREPAPAPSPTPAEPAVARVSDADLQVSVQSPMKLGDKQMPGFVQVDSIVGGENQWSSNPTKLREEGYDIPTQEQLQTLPQGKYSMAEAKKLLAWGNASNPPPTPPQPPATPRPQGAPNPADLSDIYKIFEPAPKAKTPVKERVSQAAEAFRTGLSSKFRPLNKLAEDVAKSYGRSNPKDIAGIMEQLKGSQGKGEAQIMRFDRDVSKLVEGNEKDFNPYMMLRRSKDRLQQDALDIQRALAGEDVPKLNRREVGDLTIPQVDSMLEALQAKLGPEKTAKFEQAADAYQQYMDDALNLQLESGRMSKETYDAIKAGNQFYAPFRVMKYVENTTGPEGAGARIDTTADFTKEMTGIGDISDLKLGDMLGAARQSILISRILADKNMAMRNISELAATDVEKRFIQKLQPGDRVPLGTEAVNVMEGGRTSRYAVNPDVAQALQIYGQAGNGFLSRVLSGAAVPFRTGATVFNVPFQVSNILADTPRQALVSKYGLRQVQDLVRYPLDAARAAIASVRGTVLGQPDPLFLDYLDSGVAGSAVQEYLTPNALTFREPTAMSKSKKLATTVIDTLPRFAQAIEQSNKILGVKRAIRFEGVESGAQLAKQIPEAITEIRRFSGSPDFGRQGKWTEQARLSLLYMFLNARIQGTVADFGRLTGRDGAKTAAQTWAKVGAAVGVPTAYLYALNQRPEYKEDYEKRSKLEKDNYWLIPKDTFITTEEGEKMRDYWRIPKRESAKWMANMVESGLKFSAEKDPQAFAEFAGQMIQELSPVNIQGEAAQQRMESVASGFNPAIKAPMELATGRDLYRHRPLIPESMENASPENQYTDRTAEAFKVIAEKMPDIAPEFMRSPIMVENMTRNLTAGLFTQFLPRKPVAGRTAFENNPLMQRFQALPYNDSVAFRQEMQALERDAADAYLARHRKATKLLEDNKGKPLSEIVPLAGKDPRLIQNLADLWVAQQNGITPNERKIISLPAPQRAQWVISHLKDMTPEQKTAAIKNLARKRILTESVVQEIGEGLK